MNFMIMSKNMEEYLEESEYVDYNHETIKALQEVLFKECSDELDKIKKAYYFVRDDITHSWDIQNRNITVTASEVLKYKTGICYAKSNLLAALLRGQGIPTGFCYQRITLGDTPDTGYCIHALNAVYIASLNKWIRLDARGNKEGIHAEFSIEKECLAFPIREMYDEVDYREIYARPHIKTIKALEENNDCLEMYMKFLPEYL